MSAISGSRESGLAWPMACSSRWGPHGFQWGESACCDREPAVCSEGAPECNNNGRSWWHHRGATVGPAAGTARMLSCCLQITSAKHEQAVHGLPTPAATQPTHFCAVLRPLTARGDPTALPAWLLPRSSPSSIVATPGTRLPLCALRGLAPSGRCPSAPSAARGECASGSSISLLLEMLRRRTSSLDRLQGSK